VGASSAETGAGVLGCAAAPIPAFPRERGKEQNPGAEDISIGRLYDYASRALFADRADAGKVMALAAFGTPIADSWVELTEDAAKIRQEAITALTQDAHKYAREDLAASVQKAVEQVVLFRARQARALTGSRKLCVAGGVFLNCVANHLLVRSGLFDEVFCPSAPGDDGIAIGAALHGSLPATRRHPAPATPYLGTPTDDRDIEKIARDFGFNATALPDAQKISAACDLLRREGVIFWHMGRSEFGPRALGHRSVLANPFIPGIRDRINFLIKHREPFRPVAPLVLASHMEKYFGCPPSHLTDLMLESVPVLPAHREILAECLHIDGSARVQTVSPATCGPLANLLQAFGQLSGHPILINTSLNGKDSPICETPADTLNLLNEAPIHSAFIGRYLITKHEPPSIH